MKALRIFLLVAVALLTATATNAKIWRVNPKTNSGAQYHSVDAVLEAPGFAEGDTILCDPGDYGTISISIEKVTLMGPGHDLYNTNSAVFGDIYLSRYCSVEGVRADWIYAMDDCKMSRCYTRTITGNRSFERQYSDNCTIINCCSGDIVNFNSTLITNCIITSYIDYLTACDVLNSTFYSQGTTAVLVGRLANCVVKDNIFFQGYLPHNCMNFSSMAEGNNAVSYCLFNTPAEDASDTYKVGNKFGITLEDTFTWHKNTDNVYLEDESDLMLKDGSPAKGAASHGGDCGAFGGVFPYQSTGVPRNMPRIIDAAVPATPTDGTLNVTLTITTQNE